MQRLQLDAIEEDDLVGHRIPKKFRKKKSHPHDLSDVVLANRAGDKKLRDVQQRAKGTSF